MMVYWYASLREGKFETCNPFSSQTKFRLASPRDAERRAPDDLSCIREIEEVEIVVLIIVIR